MAELDFEKLDTKTKVALTRRGRSTESGAGGPTSGMGLGMQSIISAAADKAATSNLIPVANPQVMRGMKLDPRGVGGQSFAALEEKIAKGERPGEEPSTKQGDAGNTYKGDASSGQGVYGTGTGDTEFYAGGRDESGKFTDTGEIAMARGGDLATQTMGRMASRSALKTGTTAAGMALSGFPNSLSTSIGMGLSNLTGVMAINQLAGAVIGSEIGTSVAGEATTDSEKAAREAARKAATGNWGAIGMAARGIGSLFGLSKSPFESAQEGYDTSKMVDSQKAAGEQWAQGLDTTPKATGFAGLKQSISNAIPTMKELGFKPPNPIKEENQNMSTAGDKGVLTKGSSQQKSIAKSQPFSFDPFGGPSEKSRDNQGGGGGFAHSGGQEGMTDTYDLDYGSSGDGWGTDATGSEGGFGGGGGGFAQ